ncbi:acetyl-CoA synthetase-like protein [Ceratobasidium sp. AG-I]|nr:acetyl-CoA synthetase-like protein [Ceratobasidium sp. AG-I]
MTVTSHGFESPPINNSVSPAFAVDFNLERNSSHIFAVLHDLKTSANTNLDFGQVTRAAHLAAHLINPGAVIPQGTNVGILVSTSSVMYIALVLGVMRAGLVPFPLSPRTPVAAGGGPAINSLTSTLQSELELKLIPLPSLDGIFPCLNGSTLEISYRPFPVLQPTTGNTIMAILHSSGSSGMPRPVSFDWEGIIKNVLTQPPVQIYNQPGTQVGTLGIPTFHMMGFMVQCMAPLFLGYSQVLFHPNSQPLIPSPDATIRAMAGTGCPLLITAPTFLEIWSHNEDAITQLKQMERVTFGGGPLAEWVGEKLTKRGVRLYSGYGATELGAIIQGWNAQTDPNDWAYVKFSQQCDVRFLPQEDNEGSYEIVAVTCNEHKPWVLNFEIDGKPAYRTSDLAVPHPTKPGLWKLIGRLDDQIILQNGEKTNPVPMEIEASESPLIQSAIIFGRARNQTGILIDLAEGAKGGFKDKEGRAGLVDQIWPYIERANRISSTHSRLSKDAIILVDPARPLPRTPKGTISRSGSLAAYAKEIEEMYNVLEGSITLSAQVGAPESWSQEEAVKGWVQLCVENILGRKVEVDGDLFQQGMDSLTATMLLRTLKSSLFSSGDSTVRQASEILNQQTIFSNPTIGQLARNIVDICTGEKASSTDDLTSIRSMIQKYESKWTNKTISLEMREGTMKERVVLTGTTGGLGSHLLAVLLGCEEVERVWALNRKSKEGVAARQRAAFEDKMLDVGLLESEKLVMVEADLGDGKLGLSDKEYHEIQTGATIIIHNAWQVNFNLSLQSFEPSIQGACNLLDLAFSSPARPRFLFTSSISAAGFGKPGQRLYEEYLELKDVTTRQQKEAS